MTLYDLLVIYDSVVPSLVWYVGSFVAICQWWELRRGREGNRARLGCTFSCCPQFIMFMRRPLWTFINLQLAVVNLYTHACVRTHTHTHTNIHTYML